MKWGIIIVTLIVCLAQAAFAGDTDIIPLDSSEVDFTTFLGRPTEREVRGNSVTLTWNFSGRNRRKLGGKYVDLVVVHMVHSRGELMVLRFPNPLSNSSIQRIARSVLPGISRKEFKPYYRNERESMFSFSTAQSLVAYSDRTETRLRFAAKGYFHTKQLETQ